MAYNLTLHDLNSLDFGTVVIGLSSTLPIVFTNSSDPTASQDITLGGLAAPYTFGTGDDSFTLAANGATHTVDITYTPTVVGTQTDDITGTTTATGGFSAALPISLTGIGRSPIYALPDIENNPAGVMKIDLIVDTSLPALTIPTGVKVLHIGTLTELIDVEPGVVDVQNLEIELAEDYSTYAMGFWYKVIQGYPTVNVEFRFILEEDGVDTFYFWGKVYREEVEWPEHYINTAETDVIRTVKLRLVSMIHSAKDATISDTLTEIQLHDDTYSNVYSIKSLFASILRVATGQAYDDTCIHVRSSDIRFYKVDGTTIVNAIDALITGEGGPDGVAPPHTRGYIDVAAGAGNPFSWETSYSNAYDLLIDLCLNFGWICRHFYGQSDGTYAGDTTDKHRFELFTRGAAYAGYITPEKGIEESTLYSDTVIKTSNIRVADRQTANEFISAGTYDQTTGAAWALGGAEFIFQTAERASVDTYIEPVEPPPNSEFDLDIVSLFLISTWWDAGPGTPTQTDFYYRSLFYDSGIANALILECAFYDWIAGAWSSNQTLFQAALALYFNRRFSPDRKLFERLYGSLKFTDSGVTSHRCLKPMKRIQINDQIATEAYYATEIEKRFESNTSKVLWINE